MREALIVLGLIILAVALRTARVNLMRKIGALMMLLATYLLVFFLSGEILLGVLGVVAWFFLPWIELLSRIREMRLPLNNRLRHRSLPNPSFYPNAAEASVGMEEAGFEHVSDCGWEWAGMHQFFRIFWHPEERAVAAVCLCEQQEVAFAFITLTSYDENGQTWRTTNFPFSPTLQCQSSVRWNHVPCERSCFHLILRDHRSYLQKMKVQDHDLRMPDPEALEDVIENEMKGQVAHNLAAGYVKLTGDGYFCYTTRGLFFLWGQFMKDMIRLC
jgi:hypothetical protein